MVALAGVKAVRYLGVRTKKLWEVGGRNVPMMNRGDIVVVGETVAISLCRNKAMFEMIDAVPTFKVDALPAAAIPEPDLDSRLRGNDEDAENHPADLDAGDATEEHEAVEPKKGKGK